MDLITYYNYIKHIEIKNRTEYDLTDSDLLYKNFINYTFLTVYGKKTNENCLDIYIFYTNNSDIPPLSKLKAVLCGNYYCIHNINQLPEFLLNRINQNGAKLKGLNYYYLHRFLVAISLNINNLEVHYIDRNIKNNKIDNLLPVIKEEHDLIHELEKDLPDITLSTKISELKAITTYTKNLIAKNIKDNKLSVSIVAEITGKNLKEINSWLSLYKKYGRVPHADAEPVSNVFKLPDFYIIQILKYHFIEGLTSEEIQLELAKSNLFNPKTRKPVSVNTIEKYIKGHPHFKEWYQSHNSYV